LKRRDDMLLKRAQSSSVLDTEDGSVSSLRPKARDSAPTKLSLFTRLTLRRCVGSGQLACSCLVGFYETFGGNVLSVVDVACAQHPTSVGECLPYSRAGNHHLVAED
jgi:hypothetical protein